MPGYLRLAWVTAGLTAVLVAFVGSQGAFRGGLHGFRYPYDDFVDYWPYLIAFAVPVFVGIRSLGRSWGGALGPLLLRARGTIAAVIVVACLIAAAAGELVPANFWSKSSGRVSWGDVVGFSILYAIYWGAGYLVAVAVRWVAAGFSRGAGAGDPPGD